MNFIKQLIYFFGSFYFAIILIALSAIYVIAGTFIESWADSHRYAEQWTYNHPLFQLLLAGYFINILLSALRRWPFKKGHIPFLVTHLGLLMMITGVFVKSKKGIQGQLIVWEGSHSNEVIIPHTYALHYDKKGEKPKNIPISLEPGVLYPVSFHEWVRIRECEEHCEEKRVSFIKGDALMLLRQPPLPLSMDLQPSGQLSGWFVYALRSDTPNETAAETLLKTISRSQIPAIVFIEDPQGDMHVFALDQQGNIQQQTGQHHNLDKMIVYDNGYAGYAIQLDPQLNFPFEALLKPQPTTQVASKKLEDNRPKVTIDFMDKWGRDQLELAYEPYAQGIQWPVLHGRAKVRFQPQVISIPYRIRLRNARQISYPQSTQAASFEAQLIVEDMRSGMKEEKLISMNQVHETWDGYRFYLSGIAPAQETDIRRVNLAVNYDPAKYWLTYPGGVFVAVGILLLFSRKLLKIGF